MQAHNEPHTSPALSSSRLTCIGSMWEGSSIGSSTVSKPQSLNCLKSFVLLLLKGEVKRKVFNPNLIGVPEPRPSTVRVKTFCADTANSFRSQNFAPLFSRPEIFKAIYLRR